MSNMTESRQRLAEMPGDDLPGVGRSEWGTTCQHGEKSAGKRVLVGSVIDLLAGQLLGRSVSECGGEGSGGSELSIGVDQPRDSEIGEDRAFFPAGISRGEQDIRGFHIAVQHSTAVREIQGRCRLGDDPHGPLHRHLAGVELGGVDSLHVLHRDPQMPLVHTAIVDSHNARMIQASNGIRFLLESPTHLRIGGDLMREQFERYLPRETWMPRKIDAAHSPLPQYAVECVFRERLARAQLNHDPPCRPLRAVPGQHKPRYAGVPVAGTELWCGSEAGQGGGVLVANRFQSRAGEAARFAFVKGEAVRGSEGGQGDSVFGGGDELEDFFDGGYRGGEGVAGRFQGLVVQTRCGGGDLAGAHLRVPEPGAGVQEFGGGGFAEADAAGRGWQDLGGEAEFVDPLRGAVRARAGVAAGEHAFDGDHRAAEGAVGFAAGGAGLQGQVEAGLGVGAGQGRVSGIATPLLAV